MDHAELTSLAAAFCRGYCLCAVVITEGQIRVGHEHPDVIGWARDGSSTVIECKTSRVDFVADANKPHRIDPDLAMGNLVWYATPKGVVRPKGIAAHVGVIEFDGAAVRIVRKPTFHVLAAPAIAAERTLLVHAALRSQLGREAANNDSIMPTRGPLL